METVAYIVPVCNCGYADFVDRSESFCYIKKTLEKHYSDKEWFKFIPVEQIINKNWKADYAHDAYYQFFPIFNKSWLYNCGVKIASEKFGVDSYIFADMDVFAPMDFVKLFIEWVRENEYKWAFCYNKIIYLGQESKNNLLSIGKLSILKGDRAIRIGQGGVEGGMIWFDKKFFHEIGGYNELFFQYGAEDNELVSRAKCVSGNYLSYPQTVYHLYHPVTPAKKLSSDYRIINSTLYKKICSCPREAIKILSGVPKGGTEPYTKHRYLFENLK